MSGLNAFCPICLIEFKNTDTIYSTSCGHIFHFICLNNWKSRSTTCPQCRDYNPNSHRIYLYFDEATQDSSSMTDLKAKLDMLSKDLEAHKFYGECNRKFLNIEVEEILDLVKSLSNSQKLLKENSEINAISEENSKLKHHTESVSRAAIKMLEQKCYHISSKVQKLMSNNTHLSISNMKLQSYVNQMKLMVNAIPNNPDKAKRKQPAKKVNCFTPKLSVLIKKFPSSQLQQPLEEIIVSIAAAMKLLICKDDIKRVVVNQENPRFRKLCSVELYVEFQTEKWKQKFISNKEHLKNNPATQFLEIDEYADKATRSLFTYANRKLRGKVFGYIAIKSNSVVAKRNLQDIDEIEITNQAQVDDLAQQQTLA